MFKTFVSLLSGHASYNICVGTRETDLLVSKPRMFVAV